MSSGTSSQGLLSSPPETYAVIALNQNTNIEPHLVLFLSHRLLVLVLERLVEILRRVQLLVVADQLVLQLRHLDNN